MNETIAAIQKLLGVEPDGIFGPKSKAALEALIHGPSPDAVDLRSETNIVTLHYNLKPLARRLIQQAVENGMPFQITSGTRTYEEQDQLYAQGRTKPGRIVTDARAGYSSHNHGLAFDVTLFDGKTPVWESPLYARLGKLGKAIGLSWGGDWNGRLADEPHFFLTPPYAANWAHGAMMAELRRRHDNHIDPLIQWPA